MHQYLGADFVPAGNLSKDPYDSYNEVISWVLKLFLDQIISYFKKWNGHVAFFDAYFSPNFLKIRLNDNSVLHMGKYKKKKINQGGL